MESQLKKLMVFLHPKTIALIEDEFNQSLKKALSSRKKADRALVERFESLWGSCLCFEMRNPNLYCYVFVLTDAIHLSLSETESATFRPDATFTMGVIDFIRFFIADSVGDFLLRTRQTEPKGDAWLFRDLHYLLLHLHVNWLGIALKVSQMRQLEADDHQSLLEIAMQFWQVEKAKFKEIAEVKKLGLEKMKIMAFDDFGVNFDRSYEAIDAIQGANSMRATLVIMKHDMMKMQTRLLEHK